MFSLLVLWHNIYYAVQYHNNIKKTNIKQKIYVLFSSSYDLVSSFHFSLSRPRCMSEFLKDFSFLLFLGTPALKLLIFPCPVTRQSKSSLIVHTKRQTARNFSLEGYVLGFRLWKLSCRSQVEAFISFPIPSFLMRGVRPSCVWILLFHNSDGNCHNRSNVWRRTFPFDFVSRLEM